MCLAVFPTDCWTSELNTSLYSGSVEHESGINSISTFMAGLTYQLVAASTFGQKL